MFGHELWRHSHRHLPYWPAPTYSLRPPSMEPARADAFLQHLHAHPQVGHRVKGRQTCRQNPSYLSLWTLGHDLHQTLRTHGLWANGLKPDSMAMTARIRVGSSLVRWPTLIGFGHQCTDGLRRHVVLCGSANKPRLACCLGRFADWLAVARSTCIRVQWAGIPVAPGTVTWRDCSQPINWSSPAWRISGRAVRVITANMTAKPNRAKPLCVISKKPWAMSVATMRQPLGEFFGRCHSSSFLGGGPGTLVAAMQRGGFGHLVWVGTLSISCGVDSTCAAI